MKLSPHFSLDEATVSQEASRRGIDNSHPSQAVIFAAVCTANKMEVVRHILGDNPIHINSFIRCLALNRALGSKDSSQHTKGEAVDFTASLFGTPIQVCKKLVEEVKIVDYDQLILEHTWIHISWNSIPGVRQRNQVLSLLRDGGYSVGLTNSSGNLYA